MYATASFRSFSRCTHKSLFRWPRYFHARTNNSKQELNKEGLKNTTQNSKLAKWVQLSGRAQPPNYMSKALNLFRASAPNGYDPNMMSYKLVLQACSAAGDANQALSIIGEIVVDKRRHIQLDCACMESLLASCRSANLNEGTTDGTPLWKAVLMNVENSMIRNDFLPSPFAYSDIIRLCCFGEDPSLLSQYVEHMNGVGLPLTTTNLDEMLILYKKKGINHKSLSKLLKERSTSEINYMKSRWPQGDPNIARNVQKVVDRCLRHNAIVSGDTYASMIMCMHDGGKFKESLALLEMVLGFRDCPVPAVKYLPPPCRLVSL